MKRQLPAGKIVMMTGREGNIASCFQMKMKLGRVQDAGVVSDVRMNGYPKGPAFPPQGPVQLDKACEVKLGPREKTDDDAIHDIKGPPFLSNPWFSWLAWLVAGVAWPAAWLVWAQFIMAS